ncbi:MAG: hypothetical protein ABJQ14_01620, partial [Hyphomicrobiales bacterium]
CPPHLSHKHCRRLYALIAGAVYMNNSGLYLDGFTTFADNSAIDRGGKQGHNTDDDDLFASVIVCGVALQCLSFGQVASIRKRIESGLLFMPDAHGSVVATTATTPVV